MTGATLFVGGRIFTGRRHVEALLVEGGQVLAVGDESSVRRETPTGAERRDLRSSLVIPGLADAHLHLGELTRERLAVDVHDAPTIRVLQERLRQAAVVRPDRPLIARGLDPEVLGDRRWPTSAELDEAVRGRPVVVLHVSGHAAVANTDALGQASGADALPPRPSPGPGVVIEDELDALWSLVEEGLPLQPGSIERTARDLVALGLTTVGTVHVGAREVELLRDLDAARRLPLRVRAYPPLGEGGVPERPDDPARSQFTVVGVKGFLDGAFGPRTASLFEPYEDDPSTSGVARGEESELRRALAEASAAGLAPALHAIGDRAVHRALRLLENPGPTRAPPRIEHASLTPPLLHAALRRAGVHLVVQPSFLCTDLWLPQRLGPRRARWAYAFRSLLDLGVPLAGSSDAPYAPVDPWSGMRAAVQRQDELGRSANPSPDQALTEMEALALYTRGAHEALGDGDGGSLEPGAPADLVILTGPRLSEAVRRGAGAVQETWVEGRPVEGSPPTGEGRR